MFETECFKIRLNAIDEKSGVFPWAAITSGDVLYMVKNDQGFFKSNPIVIVADPFLFVHNDELYLFYEEKRLFDPGVLKMVKTSDLSNWSEPVTVLQEPFHLSYPFVFENDGEIYLVPETSAVGEVRVYKSMDDNLNKFELKSVLLKSKPEGEHVEINFSDSSIYLHNGIFYLLTTQKRDGLNTLRLFFSEELFGMYKEHPQSPINRSQEYGRDAGCILSFKGTLYRFAQDCVQRYGDNINVFRIKELSPYIYSEELVEKNILANGTEFYINGGHQLNYVFFRGKTIIATDAKEYHRFFQYIIKRIALGF